jgi:hypothetical protein
MNTTELLAVFREEVSDLELPYLWSDAIIYTYIDDAQKQFCRNTYGIEDARSFKVTLIADSEWYAISPKITEILGAYDSLGKPVGVMTRAETAARNVRFDARKGTVEALFKGMQKGFLRAYPIPSAAGSITLETRRLPLDVVAGDDFEIDEQHHLGLIPWVKHRAYNKQDAETNDPTLSARFEAEFMAYCQKSRIEQGRLNRKVAVVKFRDV